MTQPESCDGASSWYSDMTDAQLDDAKRIAQGANAPGAIMRVLAEQLRRAEARVQTRNEAKARAWSRWHNSGYTDRAALNEWEAINAAEAAESHVANQQES